MTRARGVVMVLALGGPLAALLAVASGHAHCGFDAWTGTDAGSYGHRVDLLVLGSAVLALAVAAAVAASGRLRSPPAAAAVACGVGLAAAALVLWQHGAVSVRTV